MIAQGDPSRTDRPGGGLVGSFEPISQGFRPRHRIHLEPATMESQPKPQWVVPNPQVPRTFGLLNIIFGVIMLLVGAGYAVWFVMAPSFTKAMQEGMEKQQASVKAAYDAKIADLKRREAAAKTEEEKLTLKSERETQEAVPPPDMSAFGDLTGWNMFSDPRLAIYSISEVGAGILLNILMIVAGAGLLGLTNWGRRLALGVAWLKILRWAAMIVVTLVLILPITTERMQQAFAKMEAQQARAAGGAAVRMPMTEIARISAMTGAVFAVIGGLVATIYPALTLWFLTRPRAVAACLPVTSKPEGPPETMQWS
jgi:ABC-type multidrug transport system fused ATPase/permease subunit